MMLAARVLLKIQGHPSSALHGPAGIARWAPWRMLCTAVGQQQWALNNMTTGSDRSTRIWNQHGRFSGHLTQPLIA